MSLNAPPMFKTLEELKAKWKAEEERTGRPVRRKKLVDVCIPSYREEGYIEYTLDKLMNQSLWKEELMNIVVGEYTDNPRHMKGEKTSYLRELCAKNRVLHVFVPRKGVGFARNWTILNGSVSDIIMNFDADSKFDRKDAVWRMVEPILKKEAEMTYCTTVVVDDIAKERKRSFQETAYRFMQDYASSVERYVPIGRAIGLTFTRQAFFQVNGFPLYNMGEDYLFHYRFSIRYGIFARRFVDTVKILSSDRRARAISEFGGAKALNYSKNYR